MQDNAAHLSELSDAIERMRKSTRRSLPMFLLGIFATLLAAGIAVYYIVTLSHNLEVANQELARSKATLTETQRKLANLSDTLRDAQQQQNSTKAAESIANAISDVDSSQQELASVSTSLDSAAAKLAPQQAAPQAPVGTCRLRAGEVTYMDGECEIELRQGGSFTIWTVGRKGASATVARQGASGLGSWKAEPGAAATDLGMLERQGACWVNDKARICAWK